MNNIIVRISNSHPTDKYALKNPEYCTVGAMFVAIRVENYDNGGIKALYESNTMGTQYTRECRRATESEVKAYNNGVRNIDDINNYFDIKGPFKDFKVYINHSESEFNLYRLLCLEYNYKCYNGWSGNGTYYGVDTYGKSFCDSTRKTKFTFDNVKTLREYLIKYHKQNEKTRIITTNRGNKTKGRSCSSSRIRRIASTGRPVGNKIKGRSLQKRSAIFEISRRAVSA